MEGLGRVWCLARRPCTPSRQEFIGCMCPGSKIDANEVSGGAGYGGDGDWRVALSWKGSWRREDYVAGPRFQPLRNSKLRPQPDIEASEQKLRGGMSASDKPSRRTPRPDESSAAGFVPHPSSFNPSCRASPKNLHWTHADTTIPTDLSSAHPSFLRTRPYMRQPLASRASKCLSAGCTSGGCRDKTKVLDQACARAYAPGEFPFIDLEVFAVREYSCFRSMLTRRREKVAYTWQKPDLPTFIGVHPPSQSL